MKTHDGAGGERRVANAKWTPPDTAAEKFPYQEGAFWLGRSPIDDDAAIGVKDDRHVLLVAGTRSGKGRSVIVNNLALWPGSVISIDPKGENAMLVANRRGHGSKFCDGLGQDVYVLDPFGTVATDRVPQTMRAYYNPLADMNSLDPELPRYAARIAEGMVVPKNKNDSTWDEASRVMIQTLILHVKTSKDYAEDERTLATVRRLIVAGDMKLYDELERLGVTDRPSPFDLLWQSLVDNPACEGVLAERARSYIAHMTNNPKYFESVRSSAEQHTEWLDSPGMRGVLSDKNGFGRTFSLSDLKDNPRGISVFLCLPQADMATYSRWQRMMVDLMIAEMQKTQRLPTNGSPVLFSLDEFAGLGRMDCGFR